MLYNKINTANNKKEGIKKVTTEEMLLQLIEGQKQMSADITSMKEDITNMKEDIEEIKEEAKITRHILNRHGEILEQMVKDLEPLNLLNVKYE